MHVQNNTRMSDTPMTFGDTGPADVFFHDGAICMRIQTSYPLNYVNIQSGCCGTLESERKVKMVKYNMQYMIV